MPQLAGKPPGPFYEDYPELRCHPELLAAAGATRPILWVASTSAKASQSLCDENLTSAKTDFGTGCIILL